MITPEAAAEDDQVRQEEDSIQPQALPLYGATATENNNGDDADDGEEKHSAVGTSAPPPEGTNATPDQSTNDLPVLLESRTNTQFNNMIPRPPFNDAPVLPVLNKPDDIEGNGGDENNNNNNENENDENQQQAPNPSAPKHAPAPPPKRSLNEIVESYKNAVGGPSGGENNNNNTSAATPLADRSTNNNNNTNNSTATANVTGLKTGSVAKKKKKNSSRASSTAEVGQRGGGDAGVENKNNATVNNDQNNNNNDTTRRPSWDRIFGNANFGDQVQSHYNVLEQSGNPHPGGENQQQEQAATASASAPPSASKKPGGKKKKQAKTQPEQAPQNNNTEEIIHPEHSPEGPTFISKKKKQAQLNKNSSEEQREKKQQQKAQQVPSRPNVFGNNNPNENNNANNQNQNNNDNNVNPIANILPVLVRNMSTLEEDASISFVSVRVWVIDRNTGESYNNSLYTPYGSDTPVLVAIPAVTFPFDIRRRFSTQPEFNQVLEIPTSLPLFGQMNSVLLFEVLALGNETIRGMVDFNVPPDNNRVIAWGFLDLFGPTGDSNEGQDQIVQLFRPSATRGVIWGATLFAMSFFAPTAQSKVEVPPVPNPDSPAIPAIFHEYANSFNRNDTYPASLCIQFQHPHNNTNNNPNEPLRWRTLGGGSGIAPLYPRDFNGLLDSEKLLHRIVFRTNGTTPGIWNTNQQDQQPTGPSRGDAIMAGLSQSVEGFKQGVTDSLAVVSGSGQTQQQSVGGLFANATNAVRKQTAKERKKQKRHEALLANNKFNREISERCLPPNTMLHRFEIAGEVTAMATHERILALAITSDFKSLICFYNMLLPNMPLVGSVPGHLDYVHSLKFERQGNVIVSASSDKTVRVWKTDKLGFFVKTDSEQAAVCRHTLPHPFHVYDLDFIGSSALVTCGFDTRMYLWSIQTGVLLGTFQNPHDAFFRNLCSGGAVADSKLFALDSDYVLSTWRPMEDERTHNINSLVLRLRVRVPGALALVVRHSTVVLQCLDNPDELNNNNTNNNNNNNANGGYADMWNSPMSLVIVDAALLTFIYKISLGSVSVPRHNGPSTFGDNINNNNTGGGGGGASHFLRGLGSKSSAFFTTRSGRSRSFILPDGRLIGFASQASKIMFFDAITGELFCSNAGVSVPGASDVPLSCFAWSYHLNLCVSASALAHTDQGRVSEIVVAARPRVFGEEVRDDTKIDFLRTMFGGEAFVNNNNNNANNQQQQRLPTYNPSIRQRRTSSGQQQQEGAEFDSSARQRDAVNFNSVPRTFSSAYPGSGVGHGGGGMSGQFPFFSGAPSSSTFLYEPNLDLSHEPSLKMHQIVSHWKDVVVKRQANQATLQQQRSQNQSFASSGQVTPDKKRDVSSNNKHHHQPGGLAAVAAAGATGGGGGNAFFALANKAMAEHKNNNNANDDDDDDDQKQQDNKRKKNQFDEL